jgi:hypothetical protein
MNGERIDPANVLSTRSAFVQAVARHAIVLAGVLGASIGIPPDELPGIGHPLLFTLKLIAVGGIVAGVLSERGDPATATVGLRSGVGRYWLVFVPPAILCFVPGAGESAGNVRLFIMCATALLVIVRDRRLSDAACRPETTSNPWNRGLLLAAVCLCIAYVMVGRTATGSTDNDPAYYYGVARHILLTHRYEEPIVWHFLVKPRHVLHYPFDYWSGLASLSLLPFFWIFGATHGVAGAFMGLVSGLSVVAFAYLVSTAAPLRSRVAQLVSLLLYAFSPALMRFRFDVETIPFVHLWMILSLIALARRRPEWAVLFAFFMFWSRPEDVVLAVVVSAVALAVAAGSPASRRRAGLTLLTGALCGSVYLGYHLVVFRTLLPAGASIGRRLTDYMALYRWTSAPPTTWTVQDNLRPEYFAGRTQVALSNLQEVGFFVNYPVWIALAVIRGWRWPRGRCNVEGISWVMLFGGMVAISLVNPTMFAWQRTLHALLPVFVLAGAYGAESLFETLRGAPRFVRHLPALLLAVIMIHPLQMSLAPGTPLPFGADMAALDATLAGGTTMSPRPWSVIAETRSPAVYVPENGEGAVEAVLRRYKVRWLLLVGDECLGQSQALCRELMNGTRSKIGGVTLTKRETRGALTLFDVSL